MSGAGWPPGRRLSWILLALVAALVLGAVTLPAPVARHLLASQLERLGLTVEGLDTLSLDLFDGEASIGPVRLLADAAPPAVVMRVDLEFSLGALLGDRISIESLAISGAEVLVTRDEAGRIAVNGHPVEPAAGGASLRELMRELLGGRDLGIERLEIRDASLLFEQVGRGSLTFELDRFTLAGLRGWHPDDAARFGLEARANGIGIDGSGELSPFASEPAFAVDVVIDGIESERIEMLTGVLTAPRRNGVASFRGRHESRLLDSGALAGSTRGTLTVSALDLQGGNGAELAARRVEAEIDARHERDAERRWRLAGRIVLAGDEVALVAPPEARLAFRSVALTLEDIEAGTEPDGALSLRWAATSEAEEGRFEGRVQISAEVLIEVVRLLQFLAAGAGSGEQLTGLEVWADRGITTPRSKVEVSRLTIRDRQFDYRGGVGSFSLGLDAVAEAVDVKVVSRRQSTDIAAASLSLEDVRLQSAEGSVVLEGELSASGRDVSGERDLHRVELDTIEAQIGGLKLRSSDTTIAGTLTARGELAGMRGAVPEQRAVPPASFDVATARALLEEGSVEASPESGRWTLRGQLETGRVTLDVGHGLLATASFQRVELRDIEADEGRRIRAGAAVLTGTELAATRSFLAGVLSAESTWRAADAATPAAGEAPARPGRSLIEDVQWLLDELGYDPGPVDGLIGPLTVAAVAAFQGVAGLPVDGRVSRGLLGALEAAARPDRPTEVQRVTKPRTIEIAQLTAIDGARIHFSDDTMDPDVDTVVVFDTLSIVDLDTGDASRPAEIRASAGINEFSQLELEGRITPFEYPPEVDLKLRLSGLELSPYSPYVSGLTGITIEEGVLSSETAGRIRDGAIDGEVKIDLRRLEVGSMSEEDAERMADTLGIRVDTAVRLLKDAEGRIELTIPVSGTVQEPDVDVSDGVNRAVVGVLAAIFPPNIIAAMFRGGGDDVEFEPVVFASGSVALDDAARDYLDRLAGLMGQHPDVIITLCGRSVASDAEATASMLTEKLGVTVTARAGDAGAADRRVASHAGALAVDRARATRRYLIGERGIDPATITECRSSFDVDDEQPPRVEIAL